MRTPSSEIFKAYDVRGIYPEQLNEALAAKLGQALVDYLGVDEVLVGRDMRLSSPALHDCFCQGVLAAGAKVVDLGLCSTPMFYYVAHEFPAAAMITASHNPAVYNGFKLCRGQAESLTAETGLQALRERVEKTQAAGQPSSGQSAAQVCPKPDYQTAQPRSVDRLADYTNFLLAFAKLARPLSVVIDAGNGMAGYTLPPLLAALPQLQVERLYFELDGSFPHHVANPALPETLHDLKKAVVAAGADCGIAFDGDADRVAFVDEKGEIVRQDIVTALLAQAMLPQEPGATVLYDLRSTRMVRQAVTAAGGKAAMTRVGSSYIKAAMREQQAILAGELSGHYYFKAAHYVDDATLAMLYLLNRLAGQERPLSSIATPLTKTAVSGEMSFKVADGEKLLAKFKEHYANYPQSELDGLLVETDEWWFNLRPSNTQPLVRLNVEAKTKKQLVQLMAELENLLAEQDARWAE